MSIDTSKLNGMNENVMHRHYESSLSRSHTIATLSSPGTMALIVGATGAGKSRVLRQTYTEAFGEPSTWNNGHIPIICCNMNNADRAYFSPRVLMQAMLKNLCNVFVCKPSDIDDWQMDADLKEAVKRAMRDMKKKDMSETTMRETVLEMGKIRNLQTMLFDEGNLMCLTQRHRFSSDYLESLKALAIELKIRILIAATYDILEVWNHTAQINRRMRTIHLQRYRIDVEDEYAEFAGIVSAFEFDYGLPCGLLMKKLEIIHNQTYGVPGEVASLIERAIEIAVSMKHNVVEWSDITESFHYPLQLRRLKREIDEGELQLTRDETVADQAEAAENAAMADSNTKKAKRGKPAYRPKDYSVTAPAIFAA